MQRKWESRSPLSSKGIFCPLRDMWSQKKVPCQAFRVIITPPSQTRGRDSWVDSSPVKNNNNKRNKTKNPHKTLTTAALCSLLSNLSRAHVFKNKSKGRLGDHVAHSMCVGWEDICFRASHLCSPGPGSLRFTRNRAPSLPVYCSFAFAFAFAPFESHTLPREEGRSCCF